jgi:hypothetical protein
MLKLLSVAALASAFVLSTATVTPVSAGGHGGMRMMGGGGHHNFFAHRQAGRIGRTSVHHGPRYIGRFRVRHHYHHRHFHWRHGSYWAVGVPVAAVGVAAYAASGPAPVCTCLVKDYLDDGSVRFTDTCTKESAISMAPEPAPVK